MPRRRDISAAFTLAELILSIGIMGILMTGIASAVLIATHALPDEDDPAQALVEGAAVADWMAEELLAALWITERTATAVTFTVPDRDADGVPERIRYEWSGTSGEPLTRQYNGGSVAAVLRDVQEFQLTYDLKTVTEDYPGPPVESAEQVLSSHPNVLGSPSSFPVTKEWWPGQYFEPVLPGDALEWRVTKASVYVTREGDVDGKTKVQLRPADGNKEPTDTVLEEHLMDEEDLSWSYTWYEVAFSNVANLDPQQGLCLVLECDGKKDAARIMYDNGGGSGGINTKNGGDSWSYFDSLSRLYYVYGTVTAPGPAQTAVRHYVTGVRITLRAGADSASRVVAAAHALNSPELLSGLWEADFDSDPTLDHNGDGSPDWVRDGGGAFDSGSLSAGVWQADNTLNTCPDNDFTKLTTAEVRFRNTSIGGDGAVFRINADWSGSTFAPLFARLQLQADNPQTLTVYHMLDGSTEAALVTVSGLSKDFVTLRLLIDPGLDTINVRVNDEDRGTYTYNTIPPTSDDRFVTIRSSGSDAEFDYVSVRVSE